jgi:hypothetical protein
MKGCSAWVRWARRVASLAILTSTVSVAACATCPTNIFLSPDKRQFNALKNRTAIPAASDFDPRVTLETLLAPGNDRRRWQHTSAAAIEGVVVRVHHAGAESANCFSASRRDAHIEVARHADAPPQQRVIVEVTPPMRAWARSQGLDWSTETLQRQLTGQRVRVEGWLLFDAEHDEQAENTHPGAPGNWRATAWEIHPITAIVPTTR